MKLYTEEQVIGIYCDRFNNGLSHRASMEDLVIDKYQPIELPSDEEIDILANETFEQNNNIGKILWKDGIKWMKEQILNQNK